MKESILHYVWQFKLFSMQEMVTTEGEKLEVIDVGRHNSDAGPDFFNAKIKISNTLWAGNVEIHSQSSDWNRHNHNTDKAYDSVVLHVVAKADTEVYRLNGEKIPQLELQVPAYIQENYDQLFAEKKWIPCEDKIDQLPPFLMSSWKQLFWLSGSNAKPMTSACCWSKLKIIGTRRFISPWHVASDLELTARLSNSWHVHCLSLSLANTKITCCRLKLCFSGRPVFFRKRRRMHTIKS